MKHLQSAGVGLTLRELAKPHGIEDADRDGAFHFENGRDADAVAKALGSRAEIPETILGREAVLRPSKKGLLVWEAEKRDGDQFPNALAKGKRWTLALGVAADQRSTDERLVDLDERYRYLIDEGTQGWQKVGVFMRDADGLWLREPDNHLNYCRFLARGVDKADIGPLVGVAVSHPWRLVHRPFEPEYPGGRRWNLGAPQFVYEPSQGGDHPHWDTVLSHSFGDLDEALQIDEWAQRWGIDAGHKYGLAWVANLFRYPFDPLPYLFFYGPQNSGKSIFHESLALLMTKGVAAADRALTNASDFNGELANAVLAFVEEKNVATAPGAYAKLKNWVTSPVLWIRKMGTDAFAQPNTLHFVQCANELAACPADFDDTRITMIHVPPLATEIPKPLLISRLKEEAPHFMRTILDLPLPKPVGRLRLPAIQTSGKEAAALASVPELAQFVASAMASRERWEGVLKELPDLLGAGDWPSDARRVKRELADAGPFLRHRGIAVSWHATNAGQRLTLTRASA